MEQNPQVLFDQNSALEIGGDVATPEFPFFFVIPSIAEQREAKEREVQEEEALLRLSLICSR